MPPRLMPVCKGLWQMTRISGNNILSTTVFLRLLVLKIFRKR